MSEGCVSEGKTAHNSAVIEEYGRLRKRLLNCVDAAMFIERAQDYPCGELRDKLEANTFNLVVVGQFKRGKTCLINALMGSCILPVAVVPLTSIVTILTYGESLGVKVFYLDGRVEEIDPERLSEFVTESGNPKNEKHVLEVVITYPSAYLKDGVRLIDTPGVGSVYQHNTDVAYQYLPKSDAALFLLSVDQPVGKAELDFLRDVREYSDRIFFLLNKIDYLSPKEIEESIAFSKQAIDEAMGSDVTIFPVSAKLALQGKTECVEDSLEKSNLPGFSEVLSKFLLQEKGKVLLLSAANGLSRILSQVRFEAELERKSLETPIEELKAKVKTFEEKSAEIQFEQRNFDALLDSEVSRIVKTIVDHDLTAFKEELTVRMEQGFDAFVEEHKDLSLKELNDTLETYVIEALEQAFTAWRKGEDDKVGAAFQTVCDRFLAKMNDTVDELLTFSSQLFSIPFEVVRAESSWSRESGFYYKLKGDVVGLDMLETSLTQVLPKYTKYFGDRFQKFKDFIFRTANKRIVDKRRRHMLEMVEMQAGRMRHDFIDRLGKGKQGFRKEMLRMIDATAQGIGSAIEKGLSWKDQGEDEARKRQDVLAQTTESIDSLRTELHSIKEAAGRM